MHCRERLPVAVQRHLASCGTPALIYGPMSLGTPQDSVDARAKRAQRHGLQARPAPSARPVRTGRPRPAARIDRRRLPRMRLKASRCFCSAPGARTEMALDGRKARSRSPVVGAPRSACWTCRCPSSMGAKWRASIRAQTLEAATAADRADRMDHSSTTAQRSRGRLRLLRDQARRAFVAHSSHPGLLPRASLEVALPRRSDIRSGAMDAPSGAWGAASGGRPRRSAPHAGASAAESESTPPPQQQVTVEAHRESLERRAQDFVSQITLRPERRIARTLDAADVPDEWPGLTAKQGECVLTRSQIARAVGAPRPEQARPTHHRS